MTLRIIDIPQYEGTKPSPQFMKWRAGGIVACEAAGVLGRSRYDTPASIAAVKLGLTSRDLTNFKEESFRAQLEKRTGLVLTPACGEMAEYPFVRARFTGLARSGCVGTIKAPSEKTFLEVKRIGLDAVPEYVIEVKHQLLVSGGTSGYLYFGSPIPSRNGLLFEVTISEVEMASMLAAYCGFWDKIMQSDTPDLDPERDVLRETTLTTAVVSRWRAAAKTVAQIDAEIAELAEAISKLEGRRNSLSDTLIKDMTRFMVAEVGGLRISRFMRRGAVDYKAALAKYAPKVKEKELEAFRRKSTQQVKMTPLQSAAPVASDH